MTFFNHIDFNIVAEGNPIKNSSFSVKSTGDVYTCVECSCVEKNNSFYNIGNYRLL